jgi:ketosteroid isomerase-like protein
MIGNSAAAIMRQYWAHVSAGETAALASFFAEDAYFEDVALGHSYNGRDHIAGMLTKFLRRNALSLRGRGHNRAG